MFLEPRAYFTNVREIKLEFLRENNIKALILDVDNTLIDFDKNLSEETIKWAKELMANGIKLYVLSNSNKKQKVKMVADKLGTQYDYFAKKPLKMGFKKVQKILQEKPENIATVGDQIFTDIYGANRTGIANILVRPIHPREEIQIVLKRYLERVVLYFYRKSGGKIRKR